MSKLELPIKAFMTDYAQRAFPSVDFGRGSAARDLLIHGFGGFMQPLRHEIDVLKVNQSLANWRYMRPEDLDQIAQNWGRFRQNGGNSQGAVRLYFDTALEYQFSQLQFYTSDGLLFNLLAPVSISAAALFQNRQTVGGNQSRYFFDVTVVSAGIGSRYALPAGSIVGVTNAPPGIIGVDQLQDFTVTAPNESNFDLVNALYKNVGMRNLVGRASIRAPLLDNFPGVLDLYIAGANSPQMVRDLITVQLPTGSVQMHAGGLTDIWLNTATLQRQQVVLSYVPSSQRVKLVSADQSENQELIFDFSRGVVTLDSYFMNPELGSYNIDESVSVVIDMQDVPLRADVIDTVDLFRTSVAVKDVLAGSELMVYPGRALFNDTFADIFGLNFRNSDVRIGDMVSVGSAHRRITRISGRVIELSPSITPVGSYIFTGAALTAGTRVLPLTGVASSARVNDRLIVTSSAAAGNYTVVALATDQATVVRIDSRVVVTSNNVDMSVSGQRILTVTGPSASNPLTSRDLANIGWMYFGLDGGFDQTKYFKIVDFAPGISTTTITIIDSGGLTVGLTDAQLAYGLSGILAPNTTVLVERDDQSYYPEASKLTLNNTHTRYYNELDETIAAGSDTLTAVGIGLDAVVGDVVIFFNVTVPAVNKLVSGGDGTRYSAIISQVIGSDTIRLQPVIPFAIPAGTPYSIQRNDISLATATVSSVDLPSNTATFNSFPVGLGDGLGLFVKYANKIYTVVGSSAGASTTLTFKAPSNVRTITFNSGSYVAPTQAAIGLTVKDVTGGYSGTLYDFDNIALTWRVIPSTPGDTFAGAGNTITVIGSTATGVQNGAASGVVAVGYVSPAGGDIGQLVRQGASTGVLVGYNSSIYQWYVKPLSGADTFADLTLETFIDLGGGVPTAGHGDGTLASAPGPAGIGSGPVTLTFDEAITFVATNSVVFFSRFSSSGCNFDGQNCILDPNPSYSPSGVLTGVVPGTDQIALLAGVDQGLIDISSIPYSTALQTTTTVAPDVVRFPNAPAATLFTNVSPIAQGETVIGQTGIGRWGAIGRCLLINGPAGQTLLPIAAPLSADSIQLATGLPFTLYPGQGYTWEVVDALHLPFWIVPPNGLHSYRVYRPPVVGDLVVQRNTGSTDPTHPTQFSDSAGGLDVLLEGMDFAAGDVYLFIDSGDFASSTPFLVTAVLAQNTVTLAGANFNLSDSNVSYRILKHNGSKTMEQWYDGYITPVGSLDSITVYGDALPEMFRNNTAEQWNVIVAPSAAWDGGGAPGPVNFTMPALKLSGFTQTNNQLYLFSRLTTTGDNVSITTTSAMTVTGFTGGSTTTRAYATLSMGGQPTAGQTLTITTADKAVVFEFVNSPSAPSAGHVGVNIGSTVPLTVANLAAAIIAAKFRIDTMLKINITIDKTAGHYPALQTNDAFNSSGFNLPYATPVRFTLRNVNRIDASALSGMAQNTFNYYSGAFMNLPVVKIISVEVLDQTTLTPIGTTPYELSVDNIGLRYSAKETNSLLLTDAGVIHQPIRITYVSDPSIAEVDAYVNDDETRVLFANQMAKRMETMSVSLQVSVRSSLSASEVGSLIANFINTRKSTQQLSKGDIVKAMYDNSEISYIDGTSMKLDAVYYDFYGNQRTFSDAETIYGAPTTCYIADTISVTKI